MDMTRCPKCSTYHYGNDPCPNWEGEALLDDTALGLLKALVELLSWAEEANNMLKYQKNEHGRMFGGNPYLNPTFKQARAAIAKAEGR